MHGQRGIWPPRGFCQKQTRSTVPVARFPRKDNQALSQLPLPSPPQPPPPLLPIHLKRSQFSSSRSCVVRRLSFHRPKTASSNFPPLCRVAHRATAGFPALLPLSLGVWGPHSGSLLCPRTLKQLPASCGRNRLLGGAFLRGGRVWTGS